MSVILIYFGNAKIIFEANWGFMMKRGIYFWVALFGFALIFGFLGWAFSQHGTIGLFRVNGSFRFLFSFLGIFGIVLLGLALLERLLGNRKIARRTRILSGTLRVMTVLGIIVPVFAFIYTEAIHGALTACETPQLLIEDGTGQNGVPNLAVSFNTKQASLNTVMWGSETTSSKLTEDKSSQHHLFLLNDLQPDTKYWYQVDDGQKRYFSTPPIKESLRFAVLSDAHFGYGGSRTDLSEKMLQHIARPENYFDMLFSLGDLVDYGFKDKQWQTAFEKLSPTTSVIPTKFALGNHDTLLGGLRRYETYCYPDGLPLQTGTCLYQRIDVGKMHFFVIDLEWSAESYTKEQADWLEKQLASVPQDDWTIVVGHGFYYASGSISEGWRWYDNPETIEKLTPLFEKYGVDMVFSGHAHQLELLKKNGVTYAICGTFGGVLEHEPEYVSPASVWYSDDSYAFIEVTVNDSTAEIIFRDPDYKELKSFTINKH